MKKRMSKRPSMTSTAAIAIALIALIATFGGAAVAGKGKKKKTKLVNTVVTQTVNDPGQIDNNDNYTTLTAAQSCPSGQSAISANAFWVGTQLLNPQADQLWIIDVKRNGNGYIARGASDLNDTTFTIEVICQRVK